jgi:four helix bundle protein
MADAGYKSLISYKLAQIAFDLGWDFVPKYYSKYEDSRQRDQIKQAIRSHKQNIVEGSSDRSLSSKLKLYDVAKASGMEALEDFEDILRREQLDLWQRNDQRITKLRQFFECYPPSNPPNPSPPPRPSVLNVVKASATYWINRSTQSKRNIEEKVDTGRTY